MCYIQYRNVFQGEEGIGKVPSSSLPLVWDVYMCICTDVVLCRGLSGTSTTRPTMTPTTLLQRSSKATSSMCVNVHVYVHACFKCVLYMCMRTCMCHVSCYVHVCAVQFQGEWEVLWSRLSIKQAPLYQSLILRSVDMCVCDVVVVCMYMYV